MEALSKPQFLKVLLPASLQKLLVPPEFNKHIDKDDLRKATLLSPLNETSWYIKIQKENKCFYFDEGWKEFVEAHSLGIGYVITFRYEGYEIFTFTAFDSTACQLNFPDDRMMNSIFKKSNNACSEEEPIYLERTLTRYVIQQARMLFPQGFCDLIDFTVGRGEMIVLKDPRGRLWNVNVSSCSHFGVRLGKGLRDFLEANNLEEGDKCVFELVIKSKEKGVIFKVQMLHNFRKLKKLKRQQEYCGNSAIISAKKKAKKRLALRSADREDEE